MRRSYPVPCSNSAIFRVGIYKTAETAVTIIAEAPAGILPSGVETAELLATGLTVGFSVISPF